MAPVLARQPDTDTVHAGLHATLRAWSAKGGHLVAAYCRASGVPFTRHAAEVTALGCAFARLYDDLLDDSAGTGFAERAGLLFAHRPWTPAGPLEALAGDLFHTLERRLGRRPDDPLYAALTAVHYYQCRSARQTSPLVTRAELEEVTWGKGAATLTVLFSLARPRMGAQERAAVAELGAALQLCDDHHDRDADAALGIATLPGVGACDPAGLVERLAAAQARLAGVHGPRAARRVVDEAHVFLLLSTVGRAASRLRAAARSDAPSHAAGAPGSAGRTPGNAWAALLLRGRSAVAPADRRGA
ncbi:hypothetical protein SAMN05414137_120180 [Streptacidiphilus jiangxiensis]|uniref:Phytoene synthase n=1 Tax=Streptacidiphilus jiangxiensis TaxID=235985 RepID=A0A1H7WI78_STRJI|nr:hypothetical protein SAMN05414137_120180 [Streptacidiphilus jiangxiensis]